MIIYFSHSDMGHQVWHSRPDVALDGWYGTGHPVSSYLWNLAHLWILHLLGSVSKIKNLDIDSPFSPNFHYFTNSPYPTNTKLTWKLLNCCSWSSWFRDIADHKDIQVFYRWKTNTEFFFYSVFAALVNWAWMAYNIYCFIVVRYTLNTQKMT